MNWIKKLFPFLLWIKDLKNPKVLKADTLAGITVALVIIPQSMAYAQLAGLGPQYGLYASFFPVMIAALMGSSRQLSTGPVAVVSLLTAAALGEIVTDPSSYAAYAALLALIVGKVSEIGDSVVGIEVGDDVLVYPWIGCGSCPTCEEGDTNLCEAPQSLGVFQDGGYAEYSLVPDFKFLIKISGIDLEGAASLACSGLTAYTAVKKAISNSPENILIVGAGGLGLMAVQITKTLSNANIICADLDDEKLKKAKEMGANNIVNTNAIGYGQADVSKNIMAICNEKGHKLGKISPLFEKVEESVIEEQKKKLGVNI